MRVMISAVLAYLLSGVAQVIKDLGSTPINRPFWTIQPTALKFIFVSLTWVTRPFIQNRYSMSQVGRAYAFGMGSVIIQMSTLTGFIWCCISISAFIFESVILQTITTGIFMVVGVLFVLPLMNLIMIPLTLLLAWPLDLMFPIKNKHDGQHIVWCRNCMYHRESKQYEELLNGLWRCVAMPPKDKLPCSILSKTIEVWERYFAVEPGSRSLFPKDCPSFEKRV